MQFSTFALAAFLTASASAACPPRQGNAIKPTNKPSGFPALPSWPSVPSYKPEPTTLSSVVKPEPVVTPEPEVTPEAAVTPTSTEITVETTPSEPSSTPSSSSASSPDSSLTSDQSAALAAHNAARADVGADALIWDASLVADAQTWADHLAAQNSPGNLVHDEQSGEGENLYWSGGASDSIFTEASDAWIAEKKDYNGEAITGTGNFADIGHYTQIIWSTTTNVGIASADDGAGGAYVVARYSPPGNMIGSTPAEGS